MELLSVIRRWHYRDHYSIREISRRTGLSRNTVRKYLRSDAVEPKFNIPDRPSKLDPYADKLSQMLRQEAEKSRKQKRTTKQLHADLAALGYVGSYNRVAAFARDWKVARQQEQKTCGRCVFVPLAFLAGEAFQFDWSEDWAPASRPSCRSLTSSSPTAAPSFSAPILSRPTRCCSTPITTPSASWAACRGGAFTTICERPSTRSAAEKSAKSTRGSQPWSATSYSRRSSAIRLPAGRRAGREKRPGRPPSAVAADAELPHASGAERLAGGTLPRAVGSDAAGLASWRRGRRLGAGSAALDAASPAVRRLRRTRQARVADVPGPFGPQSLQRARFLRQSSGQRTSLSRTHRCRRRGTSRVRTSPRFCPLPPTQEYDHRFRLAALSGGLSGILCAGP
jgi:transposase